LDYGPVQDCFLALPDPAGSLSLGVPDGGKDGQDIAGGNVVHLLVAYDGEGMGGQSVFPLITVFTVAPGGSAQSCHLPGSISEGCDPGRLASSAACCFSAKGSLPCLIANWFSTAIFRALARETVG